MANYQREVYEPSFEEKATYELQDEEVEDGGARLPLLIVVALLVLAAFAGVVWLAYNQGVARGRAGAPVVIAAPEGPVRTAPTDQTAETPYTGLTVYNPPVPADQEAQASSLAPETPAAQPVDVAPPPKPALKETVIPPAPAKPAPAPIIAAAKPALTPTPAPTPNVVASIPAPAAVPVAQATPAKPAPAAGTTMLQIGAYPTKDLADAAWKNFRTKHTGVIGSLPDDIREADLGAKGTWYRLRVGPFAEKGAATAMCDRLKSEGASCFIAAP